jgi:cytochrome P450
MRLHPVAATAVGSRVLGSDINVTLSDETTVFIPKGSLAVMSIMSVHRNSNVFDDADVFKPLRWENPTEQMKMSWLPFVIGRQNCVGQSLAMAVMPEILGRLLSEFEFTIEQEGHVEFSTTYKPVGTLLTVKGI